MSRVSERYNFVSDLDNRASAYYNTCREEQR